MIQQAIQQLLTEILPTKYKWKITTPHQRITKAKSKGRPFITITIRQDTTTINTQIDHPNLPTQTWNPIIQANQTQHRMTTTATHDLQHPQSLDQIEQLITQTIKDNEQYLT